MSAASRGMTLTEVVIASALAVVVVIGIGSIDLARFNIDQDVRLRSGLATPGQIQAGLAALHIAKHIEPADRAVFNPSTGTYQFRIPVVTQDNPPACPTGSCTTAGVPPAPCCLDIPQNFRWIQYQFDFATKTLTFYDRTCAQVQLAREIQSVNFRFKDEESAAPPGGEPFQAGVADPAVVGRDNNVVVYNVYWLNIATSRSVNFHGEVTIRSGVYSNVNASCPDESAGCDSGSGLAPNQAAFDPPPPC